MSETSARRQVRAFDRPPYVSASFDPYEAEVLARGVDWRAIYTVDSFDEGSTWDEVAELAERLGGCGTNVLLERLEATHPFVLIEPGLLHVRWTSRPESALKPGSRLAR